jgi:hypothetical protein
MMQAPVTVLQTNTKRDTGKKAQVGNIMAAKVRRRCAPPEFAGAIPPDRPAGFDPIGDLRPSSPRPCAACRPWRTSCAPRWALAPC